MISRVETMVLMGMTLPLEAVRRQIASGIDLMVHLGRQKDKSRKVLEITEVLGYKNGEVKLQTLFQWDKDMRCLRKINGYVSYTHLDVYKRQGSLRLLCCIPAGDRSISG